MRTGCAIFVSAFMIFALSGAAVAWYFKPGILTGLAWIAIAALHGLFWIGAGRAIYDVYIRTWKSVEKE